MVPVRLREWDLAEWSFCPQPDPVFCCLGSWFGLRPGRGPHPGAMAACLAVACPGERRVFLQIPRPQCPAPSLGFPPHTPAAPFLLLMAVQYLPTVAGLGPCFSEMRAGHSYWDPRKRFEKAAFPVLAACEGTCGHLPHRWLSSGGGSWPLP